MGYPGERRWRVRIEFKAQDCWVGVFWRTENLAHFSNRYLLRTYWICLVPMFPIVVEHRFVHLTDPTR